MTVTVPIQDGLAKAGAGGNDREILLRVIEAAIEVVQVLGVELLQPTRGGNQIVHEDDVLAPQAETRGESGGIEYPRDMRGVQYAVHNRAGYAEASRGDRRARARLAGFA